MKKLSFVVVVAMMLGVGLLLSTGPVYAHHAFASEFDAKQPVTLKGSIVKMEWTNPHGWLYIDVKGPDGTVVNWGVELGAVAGLLKRGWRREDLPVGAEVTVDGWRAKTGAAKVNAGNIMLADGKKLFAGSSGTGAPGEPRGSNAP